MTENSEEILFGRAGGVATLTINRPQALNALTLTNYRRIAPALAAWAADPKVRVVVVSGAGGRAFCAGGDVRAVHEAGRGISDARDLTATFFREEYQLIRDIHRFPKPYVAIIDGITMGGGVGISVNGAYRVASERTLFAMPETGIGLFPDVGATRFLNRCPGWIGRYLGLSGARLKAADAFYCGFATHVVAQDRIEPLLAALAGTGWRGGREFAQVEALLGEHSTEIGPAPIAALQPAIDRAFAADTIEAILDALAAEAVSGGPDAAWAGETRTGLLTKSPTSLKVTLRQLLVGRDYDLEQALQLEYRLTQHFMAAHDFYEGVRALLIHKDQRPCWQPASLGAVDDATVEAYFVPLGERELRF
ncbi:MAG: enoyl-CoA hydratase/isomerase family protein [Alphaproteobacteria bacterium]|nr:enoyl-CoA hydratase/isomerase family protein [Alphaproteobacteria bacterium]